MSLSFEAGYYFFVTIVYFCVTIVFGTVIVVLSYKLFRLRQFIAEKKLRAEYLDWEDARKHELKEAQRRWNG